jgi:hypothetical protein
MILKSAASALQVMYVSLPDLFTVIYIILARVACLVVMLLAVKNHLVLNFQKNIRLSSHYDLK